MNINHLLGYLTDINRKGTSERIKTSKVIEEWMIDTINHHGIESDGQLIKGWKKCSTKQDKTEKKDIVTEVNGVEKFGQLKYRQPNSGDDIGIELIIPFSGKKEIVDLVSTKNVEFLKKERLGRDFKFEGDFYICSNNKLDHLRVIKHKAIKKLCKDVFFEWIKDDDISSSLGQWQRLYVPKSDRRLQLRHTSDKGRGYRGGDGKLLLYIPFAAIPDESKTVIDMIPIPKYVKEYFKPKILEG